MRGKAQGQSTDPLLDPGAGQSNTDWLWRSARGCHELRTAQAQAYDLQNDVCGEDFGRWTVTVSQ